MKKKQLIIASAIVLAFGFFWFHRHDSPQVIVEGNLSPADLVGLRHAAHRLMRSMLKDNVMGHLSCAHWKELRGDLREYSQSELSSVKVMGDGVVMAELSGSNPGAWVCCFRKTERGWEVDPKANDKYL